MPITHAFTNPKSDGGDATVTRPSDWNAAHVISGLSGGSDLVLLEQHTASSSATLDFTTAITSTYDEYIVEFLSVAPATNAQEFKMRCSTDGGSTWDTTAGRHYSNSFRTATGTWSSYTGGGSATSIGLAHDVGSGNPALAISGSIRLQPTGTGQRYVTGQLTYLPSATDRAVNLVIADYENGSFNAFQFFFSSGNIASGTIRVYGVAKTTSVSSSVAGTLLAVAAYATNANTSSNGTLVDVDATNLAPTITVPPSGRVLVLCTAFISLSNQDALWGLRDGANATLKAAEMVKRYTESYLQAVTWQALLTGLTPGASLQIKWGHQVDGAGGSTSFATNMTATMSVWAA
jgi:hypothetical protein